MSTNTPKTGNRTGIYPSDSPVFFLCRGERSREHPAAHSVADALLKSVLPTTIDKLNSYVMGLGEKEDKSHMVKIASTDPYYIGEPSGESSGSSDIINEEECSPNCAYSIYLVGGIQTDAFYFDPIKKALIDKYDAEGKDVFVKIILPYGDYTRNIVAQGSDVKHDYDLYEDDAQSSIGGQKVRNTVKDEFGGGQLIFVGHSGGGVAAYQGAKILEADGYKVKQVVQIGSPKVTISKSFQDRVSSIWDIADPVPYLGFWENVRHLHWGPYKPSKEKTIDITSVNGVLGNHTDYLNDTDASKDESGKTNMTRVLDSIWDWIKP